jgi:hypothetical protein
MNTAKNAHNKKQQSNSNGIKKKTKETTTPTTVNAPQTQPMSNNPNTQPTNVRNPDKKASLQPKTTQAGDINTDKPSTEQQHLNGESIKKE